MISAPQFIKALRDGGVDFFTGVPDSLLKAFCACLHDECRPTEHIIAANEGGAVALAAGHYLATGKTAAVYMQNSGLGNAVNPLLSLTDKAVYDIPLLLVIGWRGEPGTKDEPQHAAQGRLTLPLLDTLETPYKVLDDGHWQEQVKGTLADISTTGHPQALVVRKGLFEDYTPQHTEPSPEGLTLSREEAIKTVADAMGHNDIAVSTTGMISRELFEYREACHAGHDKDFLTVGSMGHASQIALGIALRRQRRQVWCFDGDGAVLMHAGALAIIGSQAPGNFVHVLFNNGAHDSVGGQPTAGFETDMPLLAKAAGYKTVLSTDDMQDLRNILRRVEDYDKPLFLEIKVRKGARKDLGRPTTTPEQNKKALMHTLQND